MSYTLSVVLLIPAQHREAINTLAEELGYGPGNLSVPLVHSDGIEWYGGHTWAAIEFLDHFREPFDGYEDVVSALVVSLLDLSPAEHWQAALAEQGLSAVEVVE